jgi:chromate transporter
MGTKLCPDRKRASIAVMAAVGATVLPFAVGQIGVIILGAIIGIVLIREFKELPQTPMPVNLGPVTGIISLVLFLGLLVLLPVVAGQTGVQSVKLFDSFFRAGSLVFGGGHVVLPLLKAEVVNPGWVTADAFMAGYGAAQAVPGPLFTFAAYLGAISSVEPTELLGALICLVGAFLPSFFLVFGALPFWERLRQIKNMRYAMFGINAAVVGLLLAAFYNPVWTSAIRSPKDFGLALVCFLLLAFWKMPSWGVVIFGALVGGLWL